MGSLYLYLYNDWLSGRVKVRYKAGHFRDVLLSQSLGVLKKLHRVSKKDVPPSTCYNLDIHDLITIIFGRSVTEKVGNQTMLCFPTSPIYSSASALPCEIRNQKTVHWCSGALCVQHSPTAVALSTSFLLNHTPTVHSWTHWLQGLESHTPAWVRVMSQKDWRK